MNIHIEVQPGAIATFESEPTPEALETLRNVVAHFSDPIDKFLHDYRQDIQPAERAKIRDMAAHAIQDEKFGINPAACPEHLRDVLLRLIRQEAYKYRCRQAGAMFCADGEYMPAQGTAKSSIILPRGI